MKRGLFLILIVISLIFLSAIIYADSLTGSTITGEIITGNATSASLAITVSISGNPVINILNPENKTYIRSSGLPLNYSSSGASSTWYKLDNGANTTLTGNTTFSAGQGTHTLYFFANNSDGNSSSNVTFTVDTGRLFVLYSNYSGNGSTTDFNSSTFEDLQNYSGVILERTAHGKIQFNQAVNITNDLVIDNRVDLNSNANISSNFVYLNSTALPNFNKSATISLYNLNFTNPGVLRDGELCPSTICTEVSYSGGIFIFNVTQFSNYTANETAASGETGGSTTGGGGGGSKVKQKAVPFTLDKKKISVTLNPGQVITENITITNNGKEIEIVEIENLLKDFTVRGEERVVLSPGESKTIPVHIVIRVDTVPDMYLGKLVFSSGDTQQEILIAIEVESKELLLDVRAEILEGYKEILPGKDILTEIRLFNLGADNRRKDVVVEYVVKNYENETVFHATESLAIETQTTFIKRINIPSETKFGGYVLYVRAVYEGKVASSSDTFDVVLTRITNRDKIYAGVIILLLLVTGFILFKRRGFRFPSRKGSGDSRRDGLSDYKKKLKGRITR